MRDKLNRHKFIFIYLKYYNDLNNDKTSLSEC